MTLSKGAIVEIMDVWSYPHTFVTEEMEYVQYLLGIRDTLIWQELDRMCGYDMTTAIKIAEMQ